MDSSQFDLLCDQQGEQGAEQAFPPAADVMHELKEAQIQRQFLLREATMGPQLGTEQRPAAFLRVHRNLVETIAVFIARVFAPAMTDRMMIKSPILQRVIDGVFIGMDPRSGRNEGLDEGANRGLLDIFDHPDHDGATALDHAENRRLFRRQGPPTPRALQPAAPSAPSGSAHGFWIALMARHDVDLVAFHLARPHRFGLAGHDPWPERLGHPLGIARVQPQFPGDLRIRSV